MYDSISTTAEPSVVTAALKTETPMLASASRVPECQPYARQDGYLNSDKSPEFGRYLRIVHKPPTAPQCFRSDC